MTRKIVVGVDGSEQAGRAVEWCASHAASLDAEVIAIHAIDIPVIVSPITPLAPLPQVSEIDRDELRETVTNRWCAPLTKAGVPFRVFVSGESAPVAIMQTADKEDADLVVTGRRGRGGFAELLLGSTTHALSHHLQRPLLIVP